MIVKGRNIIIGAPTVSGTYVDAGYVDSDYIS